jgi:hypothetical protein
MLNEHCLLLKKLSAFVFLQERAANKLPTVTAKKRKIIAAFLAVNI